MFYDHFRHRDIIIICLHLMSLMGIGCELLIYCPFQIFVRLFCKVFFGVDWVFSDDFIISGVMEVWLFS